MSMSEPETNWNVEWVPIGRLYGNPANPRINDAAVEPVADAMEQIG